MICSRMSGQYARACSGQASMLTPSIPGAPLLALTRRHARRRLSLASTASSSTAVSMSASSGFEARCALAAAASPPVGFGDAVEVGMRLLLVVRCSALRVHDSLLLTMAFADFCIVTAGVPAGRAARCVDDRCLFVRSRRAARRGAWSLSPGVDRPGPSSTAAAPPAAQISPGKNANCRCTSAAFTVGCVPVGFAVVWQLASPPSALYAVSVRRLAPLALRLPSDKASRNLPLPSARGYPCSR